jgi:hypothetical protein
MRCSRLAVLLSLSLSALTVGCGGDSGGGSPAAPKIRHLDVSGRWTGTWYAANGLVPCGITVDLGQNEENVDGTMFMTIGDETFVMTGSMGTVSPDNGGSGTFYFRNSDASGSYSASLSVAGGRMSGYATLAAGGDAIGGQLELVRIGNTPARARAESPMTLEAAGSAIRGEIDRH